MSVVIAKISLIAFGKSQTAADFKKMMRKFQTVPVNC